jgi:carboxypeptidase-like protein
MKHIISACFFLFSCGVFSQNITVTVDKTVTLKELFKQIENQTDFKLAFTDQIDTNQKYFSQKKTYSNIEIRELVNELNKSTPIQFSIVGNNIFVKQKTTPKTAKKKNKVTGQVFDNNNETVIGANIFIQELGTGATTDANGKFSIELDKGTYTILISYVGFKNGF